MKQFSCLGIGMAILLASSGLPAQAPADAQALADQWTTAYNDHDGDALAALYTVGAELLAYGGQALSGREAIRSFWASDFGEGNPLTLLNVAHTVDGSDMMLVQGEYDVVDRDGGDTLVSGGFIQIWRLDDTGEWRIDRELWFDEVLPYE